MRSLVRATQHVSKGLFHALAELGSARAWAPPDPSAAAHRLAGALGSIGRAHDLMVTVRGDIPRGCALLVANHISYLDPLAILSRCPAAPLAKSQVQGWPIIGPIGDALGVVFVERETSVGRARALRQMHDRLAAGVSVLNFPEGTTTRGDRVLPFWRGSFGIAQRVGVPVVPVTIHYADPTIAWRGGATFLPHYLRTAGKRRIDVTLVFGAPMPVRTGEPPEDMAARARNAIARALTHLRSTDAGIRSRISSSRPDTVLPAARVA